MLMLGLNETIDQLAMGNSVHWYDHVLRSTLDIGDKGRPGRTRKKQVEEESVKVGMRKEDGLCRSEWSVGVNKILLG